MKRQEREAQALPTMEQLQAELRRTRYRRRFAATMRRMMLVLVVIVLSALGVSYGLVAAMRIHADAMSPTLNSGDVVVALKHADYTTGDVIAYYYHDKLLVKRVIAVAGDTVQITEDGTVLVNGTRLDEPYVQQSALGQCDIEMPYTVPQGRVFVMGDERSTSMDSRSTMMGCIAQEQVVGRVILRVWPLKEWTYFPSTMQE